MTATSVLVILKERAQHMDLLQFIHHLIQILCTSENYWLFVTPNLINKVHINDNNFKVLQFPLCCIKKNIFQISPAFFLPPPWFSLSSQLEFVGFFFSSSLFCFPYAIIQCNKADDGYKEIPLSNK